MARMQGKVSKFGSKGYGFIDGEDGNKYFAHQRNINDNSKLKIGVPVSFKVEESEKGLVAVDVKQIAKHTKNSYTEIFLTLSFILHAITIYALFFK